MNREIKIFFNRNKSFLIIALICIWITVKQMNAPYVFSYNAVTSFLFERVPNDTAWGEILELLNNLGFAYYSSLIFYYVVDYFPTRKKEKMALCAVEEHLSEILIHIEKLFAILLLVSGNGSKIEDLKGKNILPSLCGLELDNDIIRYNWELANSDTGEIHLASQADTLSPFNSVKAESEAMLKEVAAIHAHVNAEMLEEEIKELLCVLSENRYLVNASRLDGSYLGNGTRAFVINCSPYDLLELLGIRLELGKLPIQQYSCTMRLTMEREIEEIKEQYEELRTRHPNEVAAYENVRKGAQKGDSKIKVRPKRRRKNGI